MLQDSVAATMLDHEQVQQRLHASMQAWVASVFSAAADGDLLPLVTQQKRIGEVHARIDIPMHVVLRGARALKDRMYALLQAQPQDGAVALVCSVIDLTMEIMGQAYARLPGPPVPGQGGLPAFRAGAERLHRARAPPRQPAVGKTS
jgi:diguanylate cyclase